MNCEISAIRIFYHQLQIGQAGLTGYQTKCSILNMNNIGN